MEYQVLKDQIDKGNSTWTIANHLGITQPAVRYWMKKYGLKTKRMEEKDNGVKTCPKCKETKALTEFYKSSKSSSYCKSCILKSNAERRRIAKRQAIEYKGGKCSKCGYNKCDGALEFHHLDSSIKDENFNFLKIKFDDKLKDELDKCILLCANCHREEHFNDKTFGKH